MDLLVVAKLSSTLHDAETQCCTTRELIRRIGSIWEDPAPTTLLKCLYERRLSNQNIAALRRSVDDLLLAFESLTSSEKSFVNRRLKRIILLLPSDIAAEYAVQFLNDRRKTRRDIGDAIVKKTGLVTRLAQYYMTVFEETGDQTLLEYVARSRNAIPDLDWPRLLENLDERYWRMRVIEALLESVDWKKSRYLDSYSFEYIYACGRCRKPIDPELFIELIVRHEDDIEFLGICAWTCGRTSAKKPLKILRKIFADRFEKRLIDSLQQQQQ